jgi:DHA2 family multidrug resistance protein-like MFS transporter
MALVVLDAGIANIALPTIGASFAAAPRQAILVVSAYQLALVMALLPCAHAAERFGYRMLFVLGLCLFAGASLLCALSSSLAMLVVARFVQGLGGAAIMALGIALLRFALGPDRLGSVISWNALTVALCAAAAPLAGALILSIGSWPWLFLINAPIAAIAIAAAPALPRVAPTRPAIDWAGVALLASAVGLFFAAAELNAVKPTAAMICAGAAAAGATLLVRRDRGRDGPVLPIDLIALRPLRIASTASFLCFVGQSAGLLALPFYMQLGLGCSAVGVGLVMICWPLTVALTSRFAHGLAERLGSAIPCAAGALLLAGGLLVSALWPVQGNIVPLAVGAGLSGVGFGLFQVPNNRTMFLTAPVDRSAAAGGLQASARLAGQTAGSVITGLLFASLPVAIAPRFGLGLGALFALGAALVSALAMRSGQPAPRLASLPS